MTPYLPARFGKWGIGSNPKSLGYDKSDGPTNNSDGGFVITKEQWIITVHKDPKKIFSLTEKAIDFIDSAVILKPFYLQVSHYTVVLHYKCKKIY